MEGITVVIPSVPGREAYLSEAIASVTKQTLQPEGIVVVHDLQQRGAAETRTRGLNLVRTKWTAFLDDDDTFGPVHLEHLMGKALQTKADLVFPWFSVEGGKDPFPDNEHREWDLANPHHTTITFLVKTAKARSVGGFLDNVAPEDWPGEPGKKQGEEFRFVMRLAESGGKVVKLHERTWTWRHHVGNTSGLPNGQKPGEPAPPGPPVLRQPPRRHGNIVGWAT